MLLHHVKIALSPATANYFVFKILKYDIEHIIQLKNMIKRNDTKLIIYLFNSPPNVLSIERKQRIPNLFKWP